MKLDKYTIPALNWTPGRRMAVHYVTAALRKLQLPRILGLMLQPIKLFFLYSLISISITFST